VCREKAAAELRALEAESFDLSIEVSFLKDKLQHGREENDSLLQQIDTLKLRTAKASQDYAQILEHREAQIKASDAR
jgi:hypothetical protein